MAARRAKLRGIGGEGILRLGDADRQMAEAFLFPARQLLRRRRGDRDIGGAIDLPRDGPQLVRQRHRIRIERRETRPAALQPRLHRHRQVPRAGRAIAPMGAEDGLRPHSLHGGLHGRDLGGRVGGELVQRHHHRQSKLLHVLHMPGEVHHATLHGGDILPPQIGLRDAAMHLQRPHGRDDHAGAGLQPRLAALDVQELLRAQIGAEARFRHHHIRKPKGEPRGDDAVAAMGDIREWSAMHQGGRAFDGLHQIRRQRFLKQHGHRAIGLDVAGRHGAAIAPAADDHAAQPVL